MPVLSHSQRFRRSLTGSLLTFGLCLAMAGCSGEKNLSGSVTFDGKPVPAGKIYFFPDPKKQTESPGGVADISGGSYDTSRKGGKGITPGSFIVRIEGFDGQTTDQLPLGKPIFVHQTTAEITSDTSTLDFQVPAAAAKKVPQNVGPLP